MLGIHCRRDHSGYIQELIVSFQCKDTFILRLSTFVGLVFHSGQFSAMGDQNKLLAGVTALRRICWFTSVILKPCSCQEEQRWGWWQVLRSFLLPWAAHMLHTRQTQRCQCSLQSLSQRKQSAGHAAGTDKDVRPPLSRSKIGLSFAAVPSVTAAHLLILPRMGNTRSLGKASCGRKACCRSNSMIYPLHCLCVCEIYCM